MKSKLFCLIIIITFFISAANGQIFRYDFSSGKEGWDGGFAEYPVGEEVFYELEFEHTSLPANIDSSQKALRISGNNHSDDLFMFIKTKVTGLQANKFYNVVFRLEIASKAPTNRIGVGGPPGEGVTLKAGATLIEPNKMNNGNNYYLMNIDKGNQIYPGADMDTLGHIGVSDTTTVFTLIYRNNISHPFPITTDADGEVWLIIGTDSGFEATTTLYYNKIEVTFEITSGIDEHADFNKSIPADFRLNQNYPNPFNPQTTIGYQLPVRTNVTLIIYNSIGQEIRTIINGNQSAGNHSVVWDGKDTHGQQVCSGVYFYKLRLDNSICRIKKLLLLK